MHRGTGRDVEAALRVDRHAVAVSARQCHELALVLQRTVGLHVECRDRIAIRHVQRLLVRTEDDAIRSQVLAVTRDGSFLVGVEQPAHREVHAALAVGRQVVDHPAQAVEGIAVRHLVGEDPPLRGDLRDVRTQAALDHEQIPLLVHRQGTAGVGVLVNRRGVAGLIELHDGAVVVLRNQEVAALVRKDAVGIVAAGLPQLGPLLSRGNDSCDLAHRVVGWWRRKRGWRRSGTCRRAPRSSSARGGRRRWGFATGDQRLVAGILWRLRARPRRQRNLRVCNGVYQNTQDRQESISFHETPRIAASRWVRRHHFIR